MDMDINMDSSMNMFVSKLSSAQPSPWAHDGWRTRAGLEGPIGRAQAV